MTGRWSETSHGVRRPSVQRHGALRLAVGHLLPLVFRHEDKPVLRKMSRQQGRGSRRVSARHWLRDLRPVS